MKSPYEVIKSRYVTEKATMLSQLYTAENNKSLARCENPKYVFIVDVNASKREIAHAVEAIYSEQKLKVLKVNTLRTKPKAKRKGRGRPGRTAVQKKAIVTMQPGDMLEQV